MQIHAKKNLLLGVNDQKFHYKYPVDKQTIVDNHIHKKSDSNKGKMNKTNR